MFGRFHGKPRNATESRRAVHGQFRGKPRNSADRCGSDLVVHSVPLEEGNNLGKKGRPYKQHGLAEITHPVLLDEPGISVRLAHCPGDISENESTESAFRNSISTVDIPGDKESRFTTELLSSPNAPHRRLSDQGPTSFR